jgi:PAS domain S-box-containing protein
MPTSDTPRAPVILIVEDDPGVALLQRRRLERAGFRAETVSDVEQAIARLEEDGVDLLVIDYRLGTTTGLDLHRRLKASGFDLPVIIVSAAMDDGMVIEAIRAGIRDVIVKNTGYLDYLPEAVRSILKQAATAPEQRHKDERVSVLIVEDDEAVARLQQRRLEREGYHVAVAATAEQATERVRQGHVHLLLLDLRLPGTTGIELYEALKRAGWNLPAVLVTGYPDQSVAIQALRAGMRDIIPKSAGYLDSLPAAINRVVDQVRLERKLVESELRLASIVGTTMDAIVMCDEDLRIVLFNPSAETMFGCPGSAALSEHVTRFIPDLTPFAANGSSPQPGSMRQRVEVEGVRVNGDRIPIEVTVSDVVVHGRRLFTAIARDVSERRRIEAELREADRRKDEFLGMLAHELRNPLAAIMSAGEVLHRRVQEAGVQKLIAVIRRQTRALARMVDDLLDVSRVTLGKIQLAREPVLLGEVMTRAADAARDAAQRAELRFDVDIDADPLWVRGDATRLEQVVTNLLNNAVKFTPAGGTITVRLKREGADAAIRIRDTGIGIDRTLLPKVFDLFVQADTSLDRAKSGLGIGLALVRQIVALHGGQVTATSAGRGAGSEFVVCLPLTLEDVEAPVRERRRSQAPRRLRVLVIDDQPDMADSVAALIETLGHDVRAVYDGHTALAVGRSEHPDVMFVDIGMPGMTGYEFARKVRSDPALARTPLVALTGYGRSEDRIRVAEAGFDLHLTKPVTDARLEAVLVDLPVSASSGSRTTTE